MIDLEIGEEVEIYFDNYNRRSTPTLEGVGTVTRLVKGSVFIEWPSGQIKFSRTFQRSQDAYQGRFFRKADQNVRFAQHRG
jgi:hypothetical protein